MKKRNEDAIKMTTTGASSSTNSTTSTSSNNNVSNIMSKTGSKSPKNSDNIIITADSNKTTNSASASASAAMIVSNQQDTKSNKTHVVTNTSSSKVVSSTNEKTIRTNKKTSSTSPKNAAAEATTDKTNKTSTSTSTGSLSFHKSAKKETDAKKNVEELPLNEEILEFQTSESDLKIIEDTLYRLTEGLPRLELNLMYKEAKESEDALLREIRILQEAVGLPLTPIPNGDNEATDDDKAKGSSASHNQVDENRNSKKRKDMSGEESEDRKGGDNLQINFHDTSVSCNKNETSLTNITKQENNAKKRKIDNQSNVKLNNDTIGASNTSSSSPPPDKPSSKIPAETTVTKSSELGTTSSTLSSYSSATSAMPTSSTNTNSSSNKTSLSTTQNPTSSTSASASIQPVSTIPSAYDPLSTGINFLTSASSILSTELAPPDRYFTVSSLLGRLREPLDVPPPPFSALSKARIEAALAAEQRKKTNSKKNPNNTYASEAERRRKLKDKMGALIKLKKNPIYTKHRTENSEVAALLALWKRISNHRTATVFRKAVNAREAPGYADRIPFPIDLGLIRRMITAGYITSFAQLHQRIGMICHNCVKFNGRESDYGVVTRDFETYVDDSFLDVMQKLTDKAAAAVQQQSKK